MFQDDRMISVLSAIVLMVAIGTVIQRADLFSDYLDDAPSIALNTDLVDARANRLLRIDVLGNDDGITDTDRSRLALIGEPDCGQVFIQGQALQYLPDSSCVGQQVIRYGIQGKDEVVGQVIAQMVGAKGSEVQLAASKPEPASEPSPQKEVAQQVTQPAGSKPVEKPAQTAIAASPSPQTMLPASSDEDAASSDVVDVLISGAAPSANAASDPNLVTERLPTENALAADEPAPASSSEPARPSAPALEVPKSQETQLAVAGQRAAERVRRAASSVLLAPTTSPRAAKTEKPQIRLAAPTLDVRLPDEQRTVSNADQVNLTAVTGVEGAPDRMAAVGTAQEIDQVGGSDFLVAVIERREPNTKAPENLALSLTAQQPEATSVVNPLRRDSDETRIALVNPSQITGLPDVDPSAALPSSPIDATQPVFESTPVISSTPPRSKPLVTPTGDVTDPSPSGSTLQSTVAGDRDAPQSPVVPTSDQLAALPRHDAPCVIPPAMTIDVRRAARSIITVDAPCHSETVAELKYSGLRIAVPLNAKGRGSQMVLGFEPNAPALLSFVNGETIDFDLPFKGIGRVSRVAVVWDMPINLELNAIEFGAPSGSSEHVRPENPRRFEDVRRGGGGFLNTYRSHAGIGQNAQIYSFWHRGGGQQGVVELMIDYASRNRDLLDGTCGDGKYATPNFLILRSEDARLERPVIRKLAALECSRVAEEKGDKRLISGAVSDLLVVQR